MRRVAWAWLALGLGCGKAAPKHLQDLSNLHFVATGEPNACGLEVHYDPVCDTNSVSLTVQVDGLPLNHEADGRTTASGQCDDSQQVFSCKSGQAPDPSLATSTFFISDGTTTAQVKVDHLTAQRSLALRQPADGVLHAGDTAVVEVQPSAALDSTAQLTLTNKADSHDAFTFDASQGLTVNGAQASFTVPAGLTPGADWSIALKQPYGLAVLVCTIAKQCTASTTSSPTPVSAHSPP